MGKSKYQSKFFVAVSFLLPVIIMLFWYREAKIFPFGVHSVITGDLKNQYLALVSYFKSNITNPAAFLYSFSFSIGGNFFSVLAYYLLSPFNLLALVFPTKDLIGFFTINILFNAGLSGFTMFLFLKESILLNHKIEKLGSYEMPIVLALSTSFALSSFYLGYAHCFMWFDSIAVLPIAVLGLERLYFKQKASLYWISYVYILLVNYYIGYMVTIFLAFSTIFLIVISLANKWMDIKKSIFSSGCVLLYTILSLLVSSIVVIPSWLAQKNVTQAKMNFDYSALFKPFDILAGLFPNASVTGIPAIYSSLLVALLCISFFTSRVIGIKEKNIIGIFILILFISVWIITFYEIWHAFTMPNGYASRESFVVVFVLICLAYRAYRMQVYDNFQIWKSFWLLLFILGFFEYFTSYLSSFTALKIILLLLLYALLFTLLHQKRFGVTRVIPLVILLLTVFEIVKIGSGQIVGQAKSSTNTESYTSIYQRTKRVIKKINKNNNKFYRIAATYQLTPNDPLLFNYNGVQSYLSQQPTKETDYLSAIGYFQKHSWIRWSSYNNGATLSMDSLLGINYLIEDTSSKFSNQLNGIQSLTAFNSSGPKYFTHKIFSQGSYDVFKNKLAFPLIFRGTTKAGNLKIIYDPNKNIFESQNKIFKTLTKVNGLFANQTGIFNKSKNYLSGNFKINTNGYAYVYLPVNRNNNPSTQIKIYANGKFVTKAFGSDLYAENGIICLGNYKKGDLLKLEVKGDNLAAQFTEKPIVAVESHHKLMDIYKESVSKSSINSQSVKKTQIDFKTSNAFKKGYAVLSIPYDKGWQVNVDGQNVKLHKVLGGLSGIYLNAGKHTVKLQYQVPGLIKSSLISLFAFLVLVFLTISKFLKLPKFKI